MQMRCLHRNYIGVSGRYLGTDGNVKRIQLTILLDAISQHVPHVAIVPPEGDTPEGGIPRIVI